jgi:HK97 family phage major capsid protein
MSLIKRAHDARTKAEMEIRSILDSAEADGREITAEDEAKIAALDTESREWTARMGELLDAEEKRSSIEAAYAAHTAVEADAPAAPAPAARDFEQELREVAAGTRRSVEVPAEKRALSVGSATAGGHTVPTSFYDRLIAHMVEVSGVRQAGPTVFNTASGETIQIPVTTSHGAAAVATEGNAVPASDPAFAQRSLGAFKFGQLITLSRELVEDSGIDLLGYIAQTAGRNLGLASGNEYVNGDGTNEPEGVLTNASAGVTSATGVTGGPTGDKLIDLYYSVISPYRNSPSCAWLMRDSTVALVRKLKDSQNQYLFQPSLVLGTPDMLLGKPMFTDPFVPAAALNAKSIVFGDWSAFFIRDVGGIRFERSDDYAFNTDSVVFRALVRTDSVLTDQTGALKVFLGAAS